MIGCFSLPPWLKREPTQSATGVLYSLACGGCAGMLEMAVAMMEAKRMADSDDSAPVEVPPEFLAFLAQGQEVRPSTSP